MQQKLKARRRLIMAVLAALALVCAFLFVWWGLFDTNVAYSLPRRLKKVAAICLTGAAIGASSLVFQTITGNRILTPSVMGLDSLFQFMQTLVAFLFGAGTLEMTSRYLDFALSCGLMILFSVFLCLLVFARPGRSLFVLVLVGMVFGSFFGSLSSFMQAIIDPNEYLILQGKMFASFNNVNTALLGVSAVLIGAALVYIAFTRGRLDVMALGRENAISLGVSYSRHVVVYLILVSLLVAVSTALVGPVTFLGVLVVNLSRELLKTFRHGSLLIGSGLVSIIALVFGQFMVERVFHFEATVSTIVNFAGGIYFLFLLLKERRA